MKPTKQCKISQKIYGRTKGGGRLHHPPPLKYATVWSGLVWSHSHKWNMAYNNALHDRAQSFAVAYQCFDEKFSCLNYWKYSVTPQAGLDGDRPTELRLESSSVNLNKSSPLGSTWTSKVELGRFCFAPSTRRSNLKLTLFLLQRSRLQSPYPEQGDDRGGFCPERGLTTHRSGYRSTNDETTVVEKVASPRSCPMVYRRTRAWFTSHKNFPRFL